MRRPFLVAAAALLASCGSEGSNQQAAGDTRATADASAGAGGAGVTMQPGQWEITTTVTELSVPNMPQGIGPPTPPPTTVRTCLTQQQATAPSGGFFTGSSEAAGCTSQNMSMANGRIRGTVQCNQQGTTMRSTMEGQFEPTSFQVNQQVETSAQGMDMTMQSRVTGRRIGDCPA